MYGSKSPVSLLTFTFDRDALLKWAQSKGPEGLARYRERKNRVSIDGLEAP